MPLPPASATRTSCRRAERSPGAHGRIWFTSLGNYRISRLDPDADDLAATVRTFEGEDAARRDPFDIKDGPDGWLWFTDKAGHALERIYAGRRRRVRSAVPSLRRRTPRWAAPSGRGAP